VAEGPAAGERMSSFHERLSVAGASRGDEGRPGRGNGGQGEGGAGGGATAGTEREGAAGHSAQATAGSSRPHDLEGRQVLVRSALRTLPEGLQDTTTHKSGDGSQEAKDLALSSAPTGALGRGSDTRMEAVGGSGAAGDTGAEVKGAVSEEAMEGGAVEKVEGPSTLLLLAGYRRAEQPPVAAGSALSQGSKGGDGKDVVPTSPAADSSAERRPHQRWEGRRMTKKGTFSIAGHMQRKRTPKVPGLRPAQRSFQDLLPQRARQARAGLGEEVARGTRRAAGEDGESEGETPRP